VKKKYGPKSLAEGIDRYFASIRRTVTATEKVETGEKGAKAVVEQPILSDTGEPIRFREYVVAPTLWGLCEALGISLSEWSRLADRSLHPELQEAVQRAGALMREWKEQTLLTRKDVRGLIYHMQNHLGGLDLPPTEEPPLTLEEKRGLLRDTLEDDGIGD
jgi:hypothetical protein